MLFCTKLRQTCWKMQHFTPTSCNNQHLLRLSYLVRMIEFVRIGKSIRWWALSASWCTQKFAKDQENNPRCLAKINNHLLIPNACALCFCLGYSGPFVWDTSLKSIDREGLGESRTGTRQISAKVVRASLTNNTFFQIYNQPEEHSGWTICTDNPGF